MRTKTKEELGNSKINLRMPLIIIFCLMVCMVLYTSRVIQKVAVTNIHEVGEDKISSVAARLDNYLEMTKSVLWVTADTVDHMVRNGASSQEILQYITDESSNQEQHFDENYTGIYGYVKGEYLDGVGWIPPEGYNPTERDWYKSAIKAKGESTIVSPYVDAQTHAVIISISRMLSNGTDVLSLDVMMHNIQKMSSELQIKDKGYGFIVNRDGLVIAHRDQSQKGRLLSEIPGYEHLMEKILEVRSGNFEIEADGEKSTAFVHQVMDQWYAVILVSNRELYAEVWQQLTVNVLASSVIFLLIVFFYLMGYKNEQNYSKRIEEMRVEEQKQAYEAKLLKLERDAAEQANQAKSDFLADMSHEIRTPINAVLGMNEMILKECVLKKKETDFDAEEAGEVFDNIYTYAGNIEHAGRNLLSIINDILDFSKIEAGVIAIAESEYTLSSVLNDVSNMINFKAQEKEIRFILDVDESLPDGLYGDEMRVKQIIINVLNNAVKYTPQGSVCLQVRSADNDKKEIGQTIRLVISVQDTGIGIKEEDIEKLFTKFRRVDLNTNSTVEGTGLGLAITHNLLKMMGGSIRVESTYGAGSTFTIVLPQKIVSCEPVGNIRMRFEEYSQTVHSYEETFLAPEARILIVDDTPMNITVAVGLLKDTQIRVRTATSGEEAVILTSAESYDLILLDQRMPRMDGIEVLHQIREQEDNLNRKTPVICLTADAIAGAKERYIAEGFTDYLAKPIDSQKLYQSLIKYLPDEKVINVQREPAKQDNSAVAAPAKDIYVPLRRIGVKPETGLQYCQQDPSLYHTILKEYARNADEKMQLLHRYYDEGDWKNYAISVHSLKSSSGMIGAKALSDIAARLEASAGAEAKEDINKEHETMTKQYAEIVEAILAAFPETEALTGDDFDGLEFYPDENGIFEFMPEEEN